MPRRRSAQRSPAARLHLDVDEAVAVEARPQLVEIAVALADAVEGQGIEQLVADDAAFDFGRLGQGGGDLNLVGRDARVEQALSPDVAVQGEILLDITHEAVEVRL